MEFKLENDILQRDEIILKLRKENLKLKTELAIKNKLIKKLQPPEKCIEVIPGERSPAGLIAF